jgi:PAS domain S-box-containing protein
MGALLRGFDWSISPPGPTDTWPEALRTSLGICLESHFAVLVCWGPDLVLLYNDAFRRLLAPRHPAALGRPGREGWSEAWGSVGPFIESVLQTGQPVLADSLLLVLQHNGRAVPTCLSFSCSPIRDEAGQTAGVFTQVIETTEKVAGQRSRTEQTLDRYRLLSQSVCDIVLFVRLDGRIAEANAAAVAAYGYEHGELLERTIFDLRDPDCDDPVPPEVFRGGAEGITFETRHRRKDGSTFPVEVSSRGADIAGERLLLNIIRDISDRKEAENALRQSEQRYRDLFENANDIIYTLDLEGRLTSVNKRAEQAFGYVREECLGKSVAEMIPGEYQPRMFEALRRKLASEASPTMYEVELICKDGRRVPVEVSSRLILHQGRPLGIQGIARDISERKRADQALRESEERLRLALDAGRCGVWDWDILHNRVTWSERIYEFHGLAPGTFGGRVEDFAALIHPSDAERVNEAIRLAVEQRQSYSEEFRIVWPNGEVRWISTHGRVLYDEAGRPVRMLGAAIDVTDRRAAEQALHEAARRKDEFLAMLAHELRNPLAPIRTAVGVLELVGPTSEEFRRLRDIIDRQVMHLARLVDDLLDVSRITSGKVLLHKDWLDLAVLVRAVVGDHQSLLEGSGLRLAVDLPAGPLWVLGDQTRLAQVVGNLLHNACKFTDAGGLVTVQLTSGVASAPRREAQAVLTIRDTGIGIEREVLNQLFEPFSQADRSLARSRGGLGLGLSLVKGLVELHGGTVQAASAGPGQGAEFIVILPLGEGAEAVRPADRAVTGRRKSLRVLIVEDNRDAADSLQLLLEAHGHQVTANQDGAAGLEAARRLRPDVVLCDIGLPGSMDGFAVARALRAESLGGIALIAISGYGQEEDRRAALEAGFDQHLTKPVDPHLVVQLLDRLGSGESGG